MTLRYSKIYGLLFLAAFGGVLFASSIPDRTVEAESKSLGIPDPSFTASSVEDDFKPVDNMHHFMEYIYEPVYADLTAALDKEPSDKKAWAKIKSGAMILAESSSLLAKRPIEKADEKKWAEFSALVHSNGSKLFHAARKKDYKTSQKLFKEMTTGCTKCHETYYEK